MKITERWTDRIIGTCVLVIAFAGASVTDRAGMPQKWHAAILGVVVPFAAVLSIKRTSWMRSTFWTTLAACFVVNVLLIWTFFEVVLRNVTKLGWIWWVPVAIVQTVVLLHFQPKIERILRAK